MTYKLITEPRLARAIKALESYDLGQIDEVLDILRAVQEREGPKRIGHAAFWGNEALSFVSPEFHSHPAALDFGPEAPTSDEGWVPLYTIPEESK